MRTAIRVRGRGQPTGFAEDRVSGGGPVRKLGSEVVGKEMEETRTSSPPNCHESAQAVVASAGLSNEPDSGSLLLGGNPLFERKNSLFAFQNSLFS